MKQYKCEECGDVIKDTPPLCTCGKGVISTGWVQVRRK